MKLRNILLSSMVAMGCTAANAQETKTEEVFEPHAYLQVQFGAQETLGELGFGSLLSPNFQVGVGYNFNKVVGARFSVNAWQSKAGQNFSGVEKKWKWNYAAPMVDATFNLTNLFCKYNPNRLVNVSVFGGVGANIAWGNDEANSVKAAIENSQKAAATQYIANEPLAYAWDGSKVRLAARVGADVDFRVSDRVKLGLEVSANTLNDRYNSKKAGNADWYFNALVGAKFALGKTHSTRKVEQQAPIERVIERVVEKQVPAPSTSENFNNTKNEYAKENGIRRDVFFTIGKFAISDAEQRKIDEIIDYLKQNPSARVVVTGYADKGTGSAAINRRIAAQRAQAVTKVLINKGVAKNRIATDSKGSDVQPFDNNDDNRVTICIAK